MNPVIRILLVLIITAAICQVCVVNLNKELKKDNVRFTELFDNNTNYDILFVGSSRTYRHIDPKIIDSVCKVNSYNAGTNGSVLYEFRVILDAYLQNHPPPKLVVLNIDLHSFANQYFFNYNEYYPYLKNKIIRDALYESGHYNFIYKILPFLMVTEYDNFTKGTAIKKLLHLGGVQSPDKTYKGYLSNGDKVVPKEDTIRATFNYEISYLEKRSLDSIINICVDKKIKIVFTYAPEFNFYWQKHTRNSPEILRFIAETASKHNIQFFRHDSLSICRNPEFFASTLHLNSRGASLYSQLLAEQLKPYISGDQKTSELYPK